MVLMRPVDAQTDDDLTNGDIFGDSTSLQCKPFQLQCHRFAVSVALWASSIVIPYERTPVCGPRTTLVASCLDIGARCSSAAHSHNNNISPAPSHAVSVILLSLLAPPGQLTVTTTKIFKWRENLNRRARTLCARRPLALTRHCSDLWWWRKLVSLYLPACSSFIFSLSFQTLNYRSGDVENAC